MNEYGCPLCGSMTFHDNTGSTIRETTPATTPPRVARVTDNVKDSNPDAFLSTLWTCDSHHQVVVLSPLWYILTVLAVLDRDYGSMVLPRN